MTPWTDLGDGIHVRQSRAFLMNSVLLLHPEHAVVVDPGVLPSEIDDIAARVRTSGAKAVTLVFTHAHWDHVLGRGWWPQARTIAHDRFPADLQRTMQWIHEEADALAAKHGETWAKRFEPFHPKELLSGLRFSKLDPWRLVFRDAFGHSDSQLSLHLPEQHTLIAADMLSDIEVPTLNTAPSVYLATLHTLLPVASGNPIETLIPGHGSIARGAAAVAGRFRRDLDYLETLDRRTRELRAKGVPLERAQQELAAMDDVERHSEFPMKEIHQKNIELAYQGNAAAAAHSGS